MFLYNYINVGYVLMSILLNLKVVKRGYYYFDF